jgi:hypothetical protein
VSLTRLGEEKLAEATKITAPIYQELIGGSSEQDFDALARISD